MLAGLMSRCTRAAHVRLFQRCAHLTENVNHPTRRQGTAPTHQRVEIQALQQLHDEIQRLVVRDPKIVELDGVRRPQAGGGFSLAAKRVTASCAAGAAPAHHLGTNRSDCRRPREHAVRRVVDLSHSATTQSSPS